MKWVILFVLLSSLAYAEVISSGEITLLALTESGNESYGSVASMALELRPGSERVFLETYPMTKITTQASLRFAQQVACKELEVDCSQYDFLFSLRALPGIVGGPSAGSAAALLVSSLLLNKTIPSSVAVTGTINSGGMIGPVGGVKEKIKAASGNGIKTVFIPKGMREIKEDNKTVNLVDYGASLNLTVLEAATMWDVLEHSINVSPRIIEGPLVIDERYAKIMRDVADELCQRTKLFNGENVSSAINFTERAEKALSEGSLYAAASYCFRANVDFKRAMYARQNFSSEELVVKLKALKVDADALKGNITARNISTLTDLQTYMAVMERIDESMQLGSVVAQELMKNNTDVGPDIAYAEERLFSGTTWARFFNGNDKSIVVDKERLRAGCEAKIAEAEERYNYVKSVIPEALDGTREDINLAYERSRNGDFIMCLYGASKAKAEADLLLSAMGVEEVRFAEVIDLKLSTARQALMRSQEKSIFPIIAFSYYEYSSSLKEFDKASSLLFAEYALELANLDIYFTAKPVKKAQLLPEEWPWLVAGIVIGLLFGAVTRGHQTLQAPKRLRGKKR